ncbi:MAG: DUF1573 domain-containing protein [Alistipes finegoldii]
MGGGLRLASTLCTFSYIREGQQVQLAIGLHQHVEPPVLSGTAFQGVDGGLLSADGARELAPGQTAEINLMYLNPEGAPRYCLLRDALEVRADGRGNGTLIVAHGIGIDKSPATPDGRRKGRTENIIKFGPVKHNAPQQQRTFTLTNTGDGELIVRAVETGGKVATTLTPGQRIPAGSSFTAKATLDPGRQEYGVVTDFVTIITNDPTRPMRPRATAIVED